MVKTVGRQQLRHKEDQATAALLSRRVLPSPLGSQFQKYQCPSTQQKQQQKVGLANSSNVVAKKANQATYK